MLVILEGNCNKRVVKRKAIYLIMIEESKEDN
jgi:hypothetical protein